MEKVKPFPLNDANFLKRLRDVAADSARVKLTVHARERMGQRRLTLPQVLDCLRRGRIDESATLTMRGDWKATLHHQWAGDVVRVAVALRKTAGNDFAVVITVID